MFQNFYVGATGMNALQESLLATTNNVSNSQTVGFKTSRVEFENLFPMMLREAIARAETNSVEPAGIEFGSGVRTVATIKDFSQGTIEVTQNPLDLAIEGEGFFQMRMPDGTVAYTRAGNFHQDSLGNIVDPNGHVFDPPITLPDGVTNITINTDGRIYVQVNNEVNSREVGQVLLARFPNPAGLVSVGQNLYKESVASGEPIVGVAAEEGFGKIAQYSLESSNVDIIAELTNLIITQRAFEIVSKAIQSGEKMMSSAVDVAQ